VHGTAAETGSRERVARRRLISTFVLCAGSWAALALCGCKSHDAHERIAVAPSDDDAGPLDLDAALPGSNNSSPHGPVPIWPAAEQEISVPYRQPAVSADLTLDPTPQQLDVQLNVDTTSSFGEEIADLQRELTRSVIPSLHERAPAASFGVSRFADFPVAPFGEEGSPPRGDRAYQLLTPITDVLSQVTSAVAKLDAPLGHGADGPEAGGEALYQIATGRGYVANRVTYIDAYDHVAADGGGTLGGIGFREQALHVVIHLTDAPAHTAQQYAGGGLPGLHGIGDAIDALNALRVYVIGICSSGLEVPDHDEVRAELSGLALATGAVIAPTHGSCPTGIKGSAVDPVDDQCPLVFDVAADGSGLGASLVDAVLGLLDAVRFQNVHAEVGDDPLGLIQAIELLHLTQPAGTTTPETSDQLPAGAPDGVPDTYVDVSSQNRLGFRVLLQNQRIAPSDVAQRMRVSVRLFGDGILLEERFLRVVIPAANAPLGAADDAGE
jgi:hypothetical protein